MLLQQKTRSDIEKQVDRVLRDLGNPEPPLRLEKVRELLKLHLEYYSTGEASMVGEVVHKIVMAGKQIWARPGLLWQAIKKCDLKALFIYDSKRILISSDLPPLKRRWSESHEVGHSIIPWHEPLCHGDQERTLSLECHEQVEAEANYAAGQLIFLRSRFREEFLSSAASMKSVRSLADRYGNTITSTLWRAVETMEVPAFGLVGAHPLKHQFPGTAKVRRYIRSPLFLAQYPAIDPDTLFAALRHAFPGGRLGRSELSMADVNGVQHVFQIECFSNSYDVLTLGVWKTAKALAVAV